MTRIRTRRPTPIARLLAPAALAGLIGLAGCDTVGGGSPAAATGPFAPRVACEDLARAGLSFEGDTTVTAATTVRGSLTLPTRQTLTGLPVFCRIEGVSRPTAASDIRFEVWLPAEGWNGRLMASGEGGFAGQLNYTRNGLDGGLDEIVRRGYATVSTDTGHRASEPFWAIGQPERVVDYAHRAKHLTTVAAKGLIAAYYGRGPVKSYLNSCSNGGRQALVQAQRYPQDYDGLVVGAPWTTTQRAAAGFIWTAQALAAPGAAIPEAKLPMIRRAVLARCDAQDGLADGLIEDPRRCGFDPVSLLCKGGDAADCLTAPQVESVRKLYSGPTHPRTGERLYPGWSPGSETSWTRIVQNTPTSNPLALGIGYFSNLVFENPRWDFRSFDFDRDMATADAKMTPLLNARPDGLAAARERGVKVIFYQGWDDEVLQPENTPLWFEQMVRASGGEAATRSFARLFMVPGMAHCYLGPGANSFGGVGQQITPRRDATHDLQKAIERWVEDGIAPESMVATRFADPAPATRTVRFTRRLCPYPSVARYRGGDPDSADSFACVAP
jgi:feruloyl esterase